MLLEEATATFSSDAEEILKISLGKSLISKHVEKQDYFFSAWSVKGSSINDVTALEGGWGQVFCDGSTKALEY